MMTQPNGLRAREAAEKIVISTLPGTRKDIQLALGLQMEQARRIINRMREAGQVHLGGYRSGKGGPLASIYHAGPGIDAVRPPQLSRKEQNQIYKQRSRANRVAASVAIGGPATARRVYLDRPTQTHHLQGIWS